MTALCSLLLEEVPLVTLYVNGYNAGGAARVRSGRLRAAGRVRHGDVLMRGEPMIEASATRHAAGPGRAGIRGGQRHLQRRLAAGGARRQAPGRPEARAWARASRSRPAWWDGTCAACSWSRRWTSRRRWCWCSRRASTSPSPSRSPRHARAASCASRRGTRWAAPSAARSSAPASRRRGARWPARWSSWPPASGARTRRRARKR